MQATEIQQHARKLYETFGAKAIAEAAQKAALLESQNDADAFLACFRHCASLHSL